MQSHRRLRAAVTLVCVLLIVATWETSPARAQDKKSSTKNASIDRVSGKRLEIVRNNESVTVKQGNRLLLEYKYGEVSHKPYVSQLTSPSGDNVLRDAPSDHLHHHGLMFAWRVNDVNFWEEGTDSGREVHTQWRELRIATVEAGEDSDEEFSEQAILRETLQWEGPSGDTLLEEERVITVPFAAEEEPCVITWQSTFTVADDRAEVVITGTQYNGLGARFLKTMDTGGHFQNEVGEVEVEGTNLKQAKWCAYTSDLAADTPVTIAMFDARGNPRHPATWYTMDQPFAYLSATQSVHTDPIRLAPGQQTTLRYGIGVYDGAVDQETLDESYAQWQELPTEIHDHSCVGAATE